MMFVGQSGNWTGFGIEYTYFRLMSQLGVHVSYATLDVKVSL